MANYHVSAAEDAEGAAVLVLVQSRFAVLEAAIVELTTIRFFQSDTIPATATRVEDMKTSRVDHGEDDGVVFRAKSVQCGVFLDVDVIISIEKYRCPRRDVQRVFNDYVIRDKNGISIPNP